jgi:hypothetical protein
MIADYASVDVTEASTGKPHSVYRCLKPVWLTEGASFHTDCLSRRVLSPERHNQIGVAVLPVVSILCFRRQSPAVLHYPSAG